MPLQASMIFQRKIVASSKEAFMPDLKRFYIIDTDVTKKHVTSIMREMKTRKWVRTRAACTHGKAVLCNGLKCKVRGVGQSVVWAHATICPKICFYKSRRLIS